MREEPRRDDVYAWSRPRVPEGNPYIWMDAEQITGARPLTDAPTVHAPTVDEIGPEALSEDVLETEANVIPFPAPLAAEIAAEPAPEALVAANAPVEDVWVELPPAPEPAAKPARARRSRAKAKPAAETVTEAVEPTALSEAESVVAAAALEPVVEATPEPVVEAAPEPEPVVAAAPEPEPAPAPKPVVIAADEIVSPPEKPKRGWWRRNG